MTYERELPEELEDFDDRADYLYDRMRDEQDEARKLYKDKSILDLSWKDYVELAHLNLLKELFPKATGDYNYDMEANKGDENG